MKLTRIENDVYNQTITIVGETPPNGVSVTVGLTLDGCFLDGYSYTYCPFVEMETEDEYGDEYIERFTGIDLLEKARESGRLFDSSDLISDMMVSVLANSFNNEKLPANLVEVLKEFDDYRLKMGHSTLSDEHELRGYDIAIILDSNYTHAYEHPNNYMPCEPIRVIASELHPAILDRATTVILSIDSLPNTDYRRPLDVKDKIVELFNKHDGCRVLVGRYQFDALVKDPELTYKVCRIHEAEVQFISRTFMRNDKIELVLGDLPMYMYKEEREIVLNVASTTLTKHTKRYVGEFVKKNKKRRRAKKQQMSGDLESMVNSFDNSK